MKKVILVFKTHFDIGFTDLSEKIIEQYAGTMLDDIIETCESTSDMGDLKFVWTMPSWPLKVMLENSTQQKKKALEKLIANNQVVWHGLPFTSHTDFCTTEDMIQGLKYARDISQAYNKPLVKSAKMTDVPGHGRILPTILKGADIDFLHLGCNEYAMPPEVPTLFFWEAPDGSRVLTMYDPAGYGSGLTPPDGWDFPVWMGMMHTHDNCGPQSADAIKALAEEAQKMYPDAEIVSGTMDDFYNELCKYDLSGIPVIKKDLADTWIHGVGSYPTEVSQIRETQRILSSASVLACSQKDLNYSYTDKIDKIYDEVISFNEHTWGLDVKTWLPNRVYNKKDFLSNKTTQPYKYMEQSWKEQEIRAKSAYSEAKQLWNDINSELDIISNKQKASGENIIITQQGDDVCAKNHRYSIKFNNKTGKIDELVDLKLNKTLLKSDNDSSLFSYRYDIHGKAKMEKFLKDYCYLTSDWGIKDNGREDYPDVECQTFHPTFIEWKQDGDNLIFSYKGIATEEYGDAELIDVIVSLPSDSDAVYVELKLNNKQETPFIESGSFVLPIAMNNPKYTFNKNGQNINPETDIIKGANHAFYCLDAYACAQNNDTGVCVVPYETPLMSIGETGVYLYRKEYEQHQPQLFFNLFNNMWGTNFPQWMGGNYSYRFAIFGYDTEQNIAEYAHNLYNKDYDISSIQDKLPINLPEGMQITFASRLKENSNIINVHVRDIIGTERNVKIQSNLQNSLVELVNLQGKVLLGKNESIDLQVKPYSIHSFNIFIK